MKGQLMFRRIMFAVISGVALVAGLVTMQQNKPAEHYEAFSNSIAVPFVGQAKVHSAMQTDCASCHGQGFAPRPSALGTRNIFTSNYSNNRCGGIGVFRAGSSSLGYDSILNPGYNEYAAGFFSGGPAVDVWQYANGAQRLVGRFGYGRHMFGPADRYVLIRVGC
jgi:hypothetical protein